MDYQSSVIVPANTTERAPFLHTMEIAPGLLNLVWMQAYPGAGGLVGLIIFHGEWRLFPTTPGEWYLPTMRGMEFRENLLIRDFPYDLTIKYYNLDTENEHKVILRVNIWPLEVFAPPLSLPLTIPSPWPELGA